MTGPTTVRAALRLTLAAVVVAAVLVAALPAAARPDAASSEAAASITRRPALEAAVLAELNDLRASRGLRALGSAPGLVRAALAHARQLARKGIFQHESADGTSFDERIRRFWSPEGYAYWSVGENLVFASGRLSAERAIELWFDSPGHKRNMLKGEWRRAGIAAVYAEDAGGVYDGYDVTIVVNDFGTRR